MRGKKEGSLLSKQDIKPKVTSDVMAWLGLNAMAKAWL
jgi:hypothetical protein